MADNTQTLKDMAEDFGGPNAPFKITQQGNTWILSSSEGEKFLFIDSKGDYKILNADQVRQAYITNAGGASGIDSLRSKLYKANYMNETEFKLKDATALNRAIIDAARTVSVETVSNYTDMATPLAQSFDSWLNKRVAMSGASGEPEAGIYLTSRMET